MKNFRRLFAIAVALAVFAVTQPGCITPPAGAPGRPPAISLSRTGRVTVDGRDVQIARLGKELRSMGVPFTTTILISVQKDTPDSIWRTAGRVLATAGYRNFAGKGPKEVTVTTSPAKSPYQNISTTNKTKKASSTTKKKSSTR